MGATASYPLEVRAQAVALYEQELSVERAHRLLVAIYGKDAPEYSTMTRWLKRYKEVQANQDDAKLLDDQYRLAQRSYELIHDAYDWLEEQPGDIKAKHLFQLNAVGGTAVDKLHRASTEGRSPQAGVYVIVVGNEPPTIEGQATLLPPATDTEDSQAG